MQNSSSRPRCMLGTTEARRRVKAGGPGGLPGGWGGNSHRWGGEAECFCLPPRHTSIVSLHHLLLCGPQQRWAGLVFGEGEDIHLTGRYAPPDGCRCHCLGARPNRACEGWAGWECWGGKTHPPPHTHTTSERRKSHREYARTRLSRCFIPLM